MPFTPPSQQQPRFAQYAGNNNNNNNTSPPPSQHAMHPSQYNTSPNSLLGPHVPAPCRQLHPPKVPLYRPAVLRSIERPIRAARGDSLTPPASSAASVNEDYVSDVEYKTGVDFRGFGYGNSGFNSADLGEIEDDDVQVTAEPDRGHWKPDAEAETCDAPMCVRRFTIYHRKHHCRRCGNIFCYEHVGHIIPLSKNARFHAQGYPSKACDNCFNDYKRVLAAKRSDSLSSSTSSSSTLSNNNHPSSPIVGIKAISGHRGIESGLGAKVGSYVGSVPRDWSWSTF